MKILVLFVSLAFLASTGYSQLICTNAGSQSETSYTNGAINDTVYFFCDSTVSATLKAIPEDGIASWDFAWQEFNEATNAWINLTTEIGVPTSTLNGLSEGGYRVTIIDGNGDIVGCYRTWIVRVIEACELNVTATPAGCGVHLLADLDPGTATPYYNPPPDPIIIDSSTDISVNFSAQHTYVSDLGFYLIGPDSCGAPIVELSAVTYQIGLPMNCNSGNNVDSLTFSTLSSNIFNMCAEPTPLTGEYGVQGNGMPIDWSPIYGCDATQPGWKVQIYDCVGLDVGQLTDANISFTGQTVCGDTATQKYESGPINQMITDNACDPLSAATFDVPVSPADAVDCDFEFEWTANPNFYIPNATTSLDIMLNPGPSVPTEFTLEITKSCYGTGACSGNWNNSDMYYPQSPPMVNISSPQPQLCESAGTITLTTDTPGGTWSGNGIVDPNNGIFDPSAAGTGVHQVSYDLPWSCGVVSQSLSIEVTSATTTTISGSNQLCESDAAITLSSNTSGGTWSGNGITDATNGVFDPSVAGSGTHTITFTPTSNCATTANYDITVSATSTPTISGPTQLCVDAGLQQFTASVSGGNWYGNGFLPTGDFNPAVAGIGVHEIAYFVDGACSDTAYYTVEILQPVPVDLNGFDTVCVNQDSLTLPQPGNGVWSGTGIVNGTNIFSPSTAGEGSFNLTYTETGTCTAPGTYKVVVLAAPISDFTSDYTSLCEPADFNLSASVQEQSNTYSWNVNNSSVGSTINIIYSASQSGNYTVELTVEDTNGCFSTTEKIDYLSVSESPTASFISNGGTYYNTTVDFTNTSTNATTYEWIFDDLGSSTDENPTFAFSEYTEGTYEVCLIAKNDLGCVDTACSNIIIQSSCYFYVPNSFSPNGDGQNESFVPVVNGHEEGSYELVIYNRWGEKIFSSTNPKNGWDGTYNGNLVQDGMYVWTIRVIDKTTELPIERKGHVLLIK